MSDNLELYNKVRTVPPKAQKAITGGRLKGMTDINPMWRIKTLTEHFGLCGTGWKYEICKQWTEPAANSEICAFVNINLYVKVGEQWSEPIPGTGGSTLVAKEKDGLHTSDECYKMALTDALSVACKALGFGADVYWEKGSTKYDRPQPSEKPAPTTPNPAPKAETPASVKPLGTTKPAVDKNTTLFTNWKWLWGKCKTELGMSEQEVHDYAQGPLKGWTIAQVESLYFELKGIKAQEMEGK